MTIIVNTGESIPLFHAIFHFFFYSRIVILFASNDPTLMRDLSSMFDEFFSCCAFIFLRDWFLTFWEEGRGGGFCCETAIIAILLHLHKFNIFRTLILFFRRTIDLSNRLINEFWAWNSGGIKSCKIVVLGNWDWDVYHAGHILGATD